MANVQGMCKNCGSLLIFDDRNDQCECVFCNCIFPAEEALKIFENPKDYTFPNEVIAPSENSNKHYYSTPVFPDQVPAAVKREATRKQNRSSVVVKENEYEISPNDVKAPKKTVVVISAVMAAILVLVVCITIPLYRTREAISSYMVDNISSIFEGIAEVDCSVDDDGKTIGYVLHGFHCQSVSVIVNNEVTESDVAAMLNSYADLRSKKTGDDKKDDITMTIYSDNGIYEAAFADNGDPKVEFRENEA
ncbi:MAG: hypothetical protein MJ153_04885 [Clostridia bacterium]|nr:hypothetical protein [Clostridia bacterium]